jgi:hypothetical protein
MSSIAITSPILVRFFSDEQLTHRKGTMNYCSAIVLRFLSNIRIVIPRMYDFSNYETAVNLGKHRGLV